MGFGQLERWIAGAATAACLSLPARAESAADSMDELSYLVFPRSLGFDRPAFSTDPLRGTVTVTFKAMPKNFEALLAPQVATDRKRRFFKGFRPAMDGGRLVGLSVDVALPAFEIAVYKKASPSRWVMRIGAPRMAAEAGALPVPVLPYADLVDVDAAGRAELAAAERALEAGLAQGSNTSRIVTTADACGVFQALTGNPSIDPDVAAFATLRAADCAWGAEQFEEALALLGSKRFAATEVALRLAQARKDELTGASTGAPQPYGGPSGKPEDVAKGADTHPALAGTPATELHFRAARAYLASGNPAAALAQLDALALREPGNTAVQAVAARATLRRRVMEEAAVEGRWVDLAAQHRALTLPIEQRPVDLELLAARAHREIGLPLDAARIYLALVQGAAFAGTAVTEAEVMTALAETYLEANDTLRAEVAIRYLDERRAVRPSTLARLHSRLALAIGKARDLGTSTARMSPAPAETPALGSETDGDVSVLARATTVALEVEGVAAARRLLAPHAVTVSTMNSLSRIARDLAAAAQDCEALSVFAAPLELAPAEDLLLAGLCRLGRGELDEALVLVEAAQVYASDELASAENARLLEAVREQARFWLEAAPAPAPVTPVSAGHAASAAGHAALPNQHMKLASAGF